MKSWLSLTHTLALAPAFMTVAASAPAAAYIGDYLPAGVIGKMKTVPLKFVAEVKPDQTLHFGNVTMSNQPDAFSLKGKNKAGNPWTFERSAIGFGGTLYQADLDRNGHPDLLLISNTAACGIAPSREVVILLFDNQDMPRGYQLVGYFNTTDKDRAIEDLVHIVGGGMTPVLLNQELVYANTRNKDRHYWRWVAYHAVDGRLKPWSVTLGGTAFPCYIWYTQGPNHKLSGHADFLDRATRAEQKAVTEVEIKQQ